MSFSLLSEQLLLGVVCLEQLSIAGLPDAVEECSSQTIDGEYLSASVAKIDQYEHYLKLLNYLIIKRLAGKMSCVIDGSFSLHQM